MSDVRDTLRAFAAKLGPICSHISVRSDEDGSYIFALGLKETHTLQMRRLADLYVVQLWHGKTWEVERVVGEPKFSDPGAAFDEAKAWLMKDAV